MATKIKDLTWNGYTAVLLRYEDGQQALWVTDEYLAGKVEDEVSDERYTINDVNDGFPLLPDADLDDEVDMWKKAVSWEEPQDECTCVSYPMIATTIYNPLCPIHGDVRDTGFVIDSKDDRITAIEDAIEELDHDNR